MNSEPLHRVTQHLSWNEPLIFDSSGEDRVAYSLPPMDVPDRPLHELLPSEWIRPELEHFPEVSEIQVMRHFTRLSTWNYHIEAGMYPLGSCTMKYNPRINEQMARLQGFCDVHPLSPAGSVPGCLELVYALQEALKVITGMEAITLNPVAGAHGELTAVLMIRAYHSRQGNPRKIMLVPDSAHGTNPASAAICGYEVVALRSNDRGCVDLEELDRLMTEEVAGLMLTIPNTLGIFEENIRKVTDCVHRRGGLIYMDGANMNALMGLVRPGDMGVDALHLNLHKTFSTPHGGGGPGGGAVTVNSRLEPYLPIPVLARQAGEDRLCWVEDRPLSIGRIRSFQGNFGILVRALSYILSCGAAGIRETAEAAIINANYLRKKLEDTYSLPYRQPSMHEVVFSDQNQVSYGVHNGDIAKRLIDYGFHPPTVSFPLIVHGALMIEPTESESREELDQFIAAMKKIDEECRNDADLVKKAPSMARHGRFDETAAARKPELRWRPAQD